MQRSVEGLRVTPWADWSEWYDLKEMLASGNVREANDRVQCYLIRRSQAVPAAMVSTVTLRYQLKYPSPDEYAQRLGLAMALVRFVNGMTDRLQPRGEGAFAKSVHGLAMELKLPLILVEIRHQASHNNLPRLNALESGARKALEWLEEYYWEYQYRKIRQQLQNSPKGFRHVFRRECDYIAPRSDTTSDASMCDGHEVLDVRSDDDSLILRKLKTLSNNIVEIAKRREQEARMEAEHSHRTDEQWFECEDSEEWRITPIGLVPGQKRAPRWPTLPVTQQDKQGLDELPDKLDCADQTPHDTILPEEEHPNAATKAFYKPLCTSMQQLSSREAAKVAEMTSYYEKLLNAPTTV